MSNRSRVSPQQQEVPDRLRHWMPEGSTVYTVTRSASRSGAHRRIGVVLIDTSPLAPHAVLHANYSVAVALGLRVVGVNGRDAVVTRATGQGLVADLARALYGSSTALRHEEI